MEIVLVSNFRIERLKNYKITRLKEYRIINTFRLVR